MKKLFTLLTLLVAIVTGAWAQEADPDFSAGTTAQTTSSFLGTDATSGITLSSTASYSSGAVQLGNTPSAYDAHYFEVLSSTSAIEKVSFLISGNGSNKSIQAPVFGWAETATSNQADTYRLLDAVTVTANSYAAAQWFTYDMSESDVKCLRIYRTTKYISSTDPAYTGSSTALGSGQTIKIYGIKVWLKASAPSITTHPVSATYADGDPISALTVTATASAGTLTYQWYSCDDADKTNATAIENATSASYTPTEEGFYYVNVKDDNGNVDSNVAHIEIEAASAPTISISAGGSTEVTAGASITLTAMAAGVPGPDIQWYVSDTNDTSAGTAISGATNATYTFDAVAGTKYYYATASNKVQSNVASNVVTVTAAARTGYTLNQVVFSNSFDAFITAPAAAVYFTQEEIDAAQEGDAAYGKTTEDIKTPAVAASIKAYYMQGETAPTVTSVNMSPGATYVVEGNTLTVTSEDGQTSVAYPITLSAVTPYDGVGTRVFDGTEAWVKTGNAFSTTSGKEGWVFSKNDNDWSRETPGKNRIYFFLAPTATVTFTNGGTARNIKVYKNGTQLSTPTSTSSCTIEGDGENNFMIAIVSNQTSGDGALKSITTPVPTLTLTDTEGSTNATAVAAVKGKTVNATVTRSLASDKYFGVFLPFALTAEQIQAAFGEGAEVATFTGEVKNGKTFMFGKLGTDEGMEAYKGYLVKAGSSYAGSFTVEGVTIPEQVSAVGDAAYAMVGTLDRYTYTEGSTIYYFTTAGTIKKLTSGGINGLRAFMADNSSASSIISSVASNAGITFGGGDGGSEIQPRAREVFGIDLEDDVVTGISSASLNDNVEMTNDNVPAYNLAGQKVGKGYKGIVIINGKKVVK